MRFVKEHLIGLIVGIVGYELYNRQQKKGSRG
jgi:hypothetical protein